MRLIDADHFIAEMEKLYHDAGWEDGEVHFSLNDLRGNIDGEKTYSKELPKWIVHHIVGSKDPADWLLTSDYYICPACNNSSARQYAYCPSCGEKLGRKLYSD